MGEHFDLVTSRFKNMLARITGGSFVVACQHHTNDVAHQGNHRLVSVALTFHRFAAAMMANEEEAAPLPP